MSKIVFLGDSITEYMPYVYKDKVGGEEDVVSYHGVENIGVGCFVPFSGLCIIMYIHTGPRELP